MPPPAYSAADLLWIVFSIFLLGLGKGGFPVGSAATPLLVLAWPQQTHAARAAVAFMLPVLCVMDVIAVLAYRRSIRWRGLLPILPGTLAGVAVGSLLFMSENSRLIALSDRNLKLLIGVLGVAFTVYHLAARRIAGRIDAGGARRPAVATLYGLGAGVTSTLAHAAGPVFQMYLLPQRLPKIEFAATTAAYFFVLNLVKMIPFTASGRILGADLALAARMLPVIPLGVGCGYLLVRVMKPRHYTAFIQVVLAATSLTLIVRAFAE